MNDILRKIPVRTATTIVIILIGMALLAIMVMGYQIFIRKDSRDVVTRFATTTPLPTAVPSQTPQPLPTSITPDLEPALVTQTPNPENETGVETTLPNNGAHSTFAPTNQPCENCHQNLRGGS